MNESVENIELHEPEQLDLWRAGIAAFFAAVLSNALAHYAISLIMQYPADFAPLRLSSIAIFTGIAAILATVLLALLRRRTRHAERSFKRIGYGLLALSILPNVLGFFLPDLIPISGGTAAGYLLLIPFHLIAGVVIIGLLTRLSEP